MEITVEPSKTYAVTTSGSCTVTDADGLELCTASSGSQAFFVATTPTVTVSDDGAKVSRATFNYALARQSAGGGATSELPPGYTRLEYLESTGTQYILLPDLYTGSAEVQLVFKNTSVDGGNGGLFGGNLTTIAQWGVAVFNNYNSEVLAIYQNSRLNRSVPLQSVVTVAITPKAIKIDNDYVEVSKNVNNVKFFVALFAVAQYGQGGEVVVNYVSKNVQLYSCRVKDEKENFDFCPALDPTGTPCMFDLVSKQAFRNGGSGQFTAGVAGVGVLANILLALPYKEEAGSKLHVRLPDGANMSEAQRIADLAGELKNWQITFA